MKLYPFNEVAKTAEATMNKGHTVYQQFLCAKCGAKQTMDTPNQFFTSGSCEQCNHVTDIEKDGCNFMAVLTV